MMFNFWEFEILVFRATYNSGYDRDSGNDIGLSTLNLNQSQDYIHIIYVKNG